jgi:hypothetical protein
MEPVTIMAGMAADCFALKKKRSVGCKCLSNGDDQ